MTIQHVRHSSHWGAFSAAVQDGKVVGVRPFERDPHPGYLAESVPDAVHSPTRIDRPYIRKGWLERGPTGHDTQRGREPFVAVPWDEALDLVAREVKRVRDQHGPTSIFGGSYGWSSAGRFHHARTHLHRFLGAAGGFTSQVTNYSYAAGMTILPHLLGGNEAVAGPVSSWATICRHAKIVVAFGGLALKNGQVVSGGFGEHAYERWLREAAKAGLRIVNISPLRQDCPDFLNAEWIPIRPHGDMPMMLAMAHVLISEGRADHAFLDRYTSGYPRLRAYILGESDGVAKSPAWAAPLAGISAETIRDLARDIAANPTMLTAAWSIQRAEHGEQPYWMLIALAAMLGQIGLPGTGFGFGYGSINGMGNNKIEGTPAISLSSGKNPTGLFLPVARITDMLESPGGGCNYNGKWVPYPDVRMIYWAGGNPFHHHQDLNRLLRAWAKPETVIVHEPWWTAVARFADIVLPATTTLERNDIGSTSRDRFMMAMHKAVEPQGEARDDFAIFTAVAERLGCAAAYTEGRDEMGWLRHLYDIARQQVARLGLTMPDFDTFWAQGYVEFPEPAPGQEYVLLSEFRADPEQNRLRTASGRIELYSERIAGFNYADCPGHPTWFEPKEWLGSPEAARYPLHLLSFQPATRLHSQLDQGRVSKASKVQGREPILLHPADAAPRGIKDGDVVRVFNDRGQCLAGVRLSDAQRPGVVAMATGAWIDYAVPGEPGSLDVHGNPNILTRDVGTSQLGQGPVAQSCLVEIERWQGALPPITCHAPPPVVERQR
ncbi:MAG: molybdopterin guanine dinucleotide-containing S/N-oxide reductase [Alphaproteobacteria bacterium]|nr:molybdopterin guanine dinucleotide-containing S/N-oxide reductase [Alphaproteobacteria bacterium]